MSPRSTEEYLRTAKRRYGIAFGHENKSTGYPNKRPANVTWIGGKDGKSTGGAWHLPPGKFRVVEQEYVPGADKYFGREYEVEPIKHLRQYLNKDWEQRRPTYLTIRSFHNKFIKPAIDFDNGHSATSPAAPILSGEWLAMGAFVAHHTDAMCKLPPGFTQVAIALKVDVAAQTHITKSGCHMTICNVGMLPHMANEMLRSFQYELCKLSGMKEDQVRPETRIYHYTPPNDAARLSSPTSQQQFQITEKWSDVLKGSFSFKKRASSALVNPAEFFDQAGLMAVRPMYSIVSGKAYVPFALVQGGTCEVVKRWEAPEFTPNARMGPQNAPEAERIRIAGSIFDPPLSDTVVASLQGSKAYKVLARPYGYESHLILHGYQLDRQVATGGRKVTTNKQKGCERPEEPRSIPVVIPAKGAIELYRRKATERVQDNEDARLQQAIYVAMLARFGREEDPPDVGDGDAERKPRRRPLSDATLRKAGDLSPDFKLALDLGKHAKSSDPFIYGWEHIWLDIKGEDFEFPVLFRIWDHLKEQGWRLKRGVGVCKKYKTKRLTELRSTALLFRAEDGVLPVCPYKQAPHSSDKEVFLMVFGDRAGEAYVQCNGMKPECCEARGKTPRQYSTIPFKSEVSKFHKNLQTLFNVLWDSKESNHAGEKEIRTLEIKEQKTRDTEQRQKEHFAPKQALTGVSNEDLQAMKNKVMRLLGNR